ncbi:hypothetical protein [Oceanicola sp. 22II-s10i]|uniref:hypothetical protein n=1 Tax=Oceanicola sp. 22II-s10i TaxID=1317116 RepID=UPI000B5263B2|nr:hypothetical protein [Oceanicola sp. 22II-s10i]
MSAPDTNIERQKKHHAIPIWGIVLAIVFGVIFGGLLTTGAALYNGSTPDGAAVQIDGRTGTEEAAD